MSVGAALALSQPLKLWALPLLPSGRTSTSLDKLWWVLLPSPTSTMFTFLPSPQTRGNLRSSSSIFL